MERVTKKDNDGHYYMIGDGIFSDWGVPEKFKGEDVDAVGAIEDILGDDYDLDCLRVLVETDRPISAHWIIRKEDYGVSTLTGYRVEHTKYTCSNCGYETGSQAEKFVCCPICTARMDGGKHETD